MDEHGTKVADGRPFADLRWFRFATLPPAEMQEAAENHLIPFLRRLGSDGAPLRKHMGSARYEIPTARLLARVVDLLGELPMQQRDTKGDLYEYMLSKIASAGQNGQFRTPRHIIELMVAMTEPRRDDVICDPACGTAGFLVGAAEYLRKHDPDIWTDPEAKRHLETAVFHGHDFDGTMLRLGAMNMALHGLEDAAITYRDSLTQEHGDEAEAYSLILANPPFAGSLDTEAVAKDLILLIAFMIACLHPDGPYFILQIHGEQGSGKSIIGKLVKDTLDPNQADRLRLPQTEQDLAIFAQAHWILNFENVSGMSADISDALCTVATGGAIAKRRLYTDSDQVILRFKRPIAINGIGDYASRPDLQERSIPLFLETIGPDQRKTESELNAALEVLTPKLLGYLFDCAAYALAHLHEVEVPRTIRMADAAHWLLAAEPATAFEPGSILRALEEVQGQLISRTVANDNVTVALLRLLHRRAEHRFEGRYGQLHEILRAQSEDRGRHLPRSPSALSSRLERLKPALRKIGLVVEDGARLASGQTVVIHLTPAGVALAAEFGDDDHDRGPSY